MNNGKKVEWPVEQVERLVTPLVIPIYCLLSSSLSLEPVRLKPPVKPKEIFATAAHSLTVGSRSVTPQRPFSPLNGNQDQFDVDDPFVAMICNHMRGTSLIPSSWPAW
jgi:hypothetical protein